MMLYRTTSTPVFSLRREIDRLFDDAFGSTDDRRLAWSPSVDVREDDRALRFDVELPGVNPEDVEITAEGGVLTIRGEKSAKTEKEGNEGRWHFVERSYGSFMRSFQLPQAVDEDKISADYANGVLTIEVPKAELPQPRKIQIRSEQQQAQVGSGGGRTNRAARADEAGRQQNGGDGERGGGERTGTTESSSRRREPAGA